MTVILKKWVGTKTRSSPLCMFYVKFKHTKDNVVGYLAPNWYGIFCGLLIEFILTEKLAQHFNLEIVMNKHLDQILESTLHALFCLFTDITII